MAHSSSNDEFLHANASSKSNLEERTLLFFQMVRNSLCVSGTSHFWTTFDVSCAHFFVFSRSLVFTCCFSFVLFLLAFFKYTVRVSRDDHPQSTAHHINHNNRNAVDILNACMDS